MIGDPFPGDCRKCIIAVRGGGDECKNCLGKEFEKMRWFRDFLADAIREHNPSLIVEGDRGTASVRGDDGDVCDYKGGLDVTDPISGFSWEVTLNMGYADIENKNEIRDTA